MNKYSADTSGLILMFCAVRGIQISEAQSIDLAELIEIYSTKYYGNKAEDAIKQYYSNQM